MSQQASDELPPALGRVVDGWLAHLSVELGRSANTVAAYRRDAHRYCAWLQDRGISDLAEVSEADVTAFLQDLGRSTPGHPGLAASSTARILAAVRGLHHFAHADGLVPVDAAADVRTPHVRRRLPTSLSIDQVQHLLDSCDTTGVEGLLESVLLELLYGTGARISEVCRLDVDDLTRVVDDPDAGLRLFGKGSKERMVPLGRYARDAVQAWLVRGRPARLRHATPALLLNHRGDRLSRQSAWAIVQRVGERAGVGPLHPHTLRHSYATHLLEGGADVRVVQELLGHASVTTTQIYTLVTIDHLREVYRQAHPRALGAPR